MNHYTYRAEWSPEHGEYVARCLEIASLSRWAPTLREAIAGSSEQSMSSSPSGTQRVMTCQCP